MKPSSRCRRVIKRDVILILPEAIKSFLLLLYRFYIHVCAHLLNRIKNKIADNAYICTRVKIITVKLENTGSSAYAKVRIDGENGIKFTNAAVGDGINPDTAVKVSSNGSYVTFNGTNLLGAGKSGYLYLKYEGEIDPDKLPVIVKLYRRNI